MVRKSSEGSASNRYPLRSAHSSGRVLRSASIKNNKACSEPLNDSAAAQPETKKRKSGSPSEDPNNSVRVLRSASKNKDGACSEPLNDSTAGEPAENKRKSVSPLKVGSPNNSVRVLRSASKNKNELCSEPLNDSTVAQPAVKRRKSGSLSKVRSPVSSARVLRSTSKVKNETCHEPLNDSTAAQPAARKRKSGTPSKTDCPKVGVRVLRSATKKKNETCSEPLNDITSAQPSARKRKSGRRSKDRSPKKDYLKICQRVRYILNRMNYEQSLIQAYASEGWRGQSLEKIRPEKELERAKAEILRCKLRIREAFRNMDYLLSEGKLEESLFDSAGEISSEDIFCAICGTKDVTLQNDIILCDGACDRGFHQNCLNPPLLTEDIPPGDEGWLCPTCVCKLDCIDALNELQGSKLSIHDSWEEVFPEAASLANGSKQVDASNLQPNDSEDNDYNPALAEGHMVNEDRSSAEDEGKVDDLGLPSEDSEDDDFDPTGPDSSEDRKNESNSEESDFTSDSDDFCAEIAKSRGLDEVSISPLSNVIDHADRMKISAVDNHFNEENSNRAFVEMELEQDMILPVSSRRQVERLDYKKLYDEAYGESSDSSDDEEWSGKEQLEGSETDLPGAPLYPAKRCSRRAPAGQQNNEHTPQREWLHGSVSEQQTEVLHSNVSSSTARKHHFGPIISQKLKVHFEKDPYPSRPAKESLAQELGLTFIQVSKWFSATRHYSRVAAAKNKKHPGKYTIENINSTAVDNIQVREPNVGFMEKPTADRNDMISKKLLVQINLNEGNEEDIPHSQDTRCEQRVIMTPTTISRDVGSPGYGPGENQGNGGSRNTRCEQSVVMTPTTISREVGPPGYGPEENQGNGTSWNMRCGQSVFMSPMTISREVGPPGYVPGENQGSGALWSASWEQRVFRSPTAIAGEVGLPGHGPGENQGNVASWSTSWEQRVFMSPTTIAREVGPLGYGPGENQGNGASWNTSCEQRMFTSPTKISREVGPPGYDPVENQGTGGARNINFEQRRVMTPTTISREVFPPGYGPGENQGNGASGNVRSPQGRSAEKVELSDEARKKAILRELRRRQKFR
ncbi:homeobox protein HAZ1-like [Phragmites australis]|uniref:homeobox protein HAZ1-like n=1 Tax=Phragmites australis TaxID=29695 RepID=UPI002D78724F|nr:homeobox protein HAZ1-like [Phragmites australis]